MNILIHRLAICKCSENVVVCIDIHCGCLRQDGIFLEEARLKSRSIRFRLKFDALGLRDQRSLLLD